MLVIISCKVIQIATCSCSTRLRAAVARQPAATSQSCIADAHAIQTIHLQVPRTLPEQYAQLNRVILTAIIHNTAQWYDTMVFVTLGSLVAAAYFPGATETERLLALFGVFAAGYVLRPLGALVFPFVEGRWGRKASIGWALGLSALPTALMGAMPGYAQVGWAAQAVVTLSLWVLMRVARSAWSIGA